MGPCIIMLQHEVMVVDEWHNNGPQDPRSSIHNVDINRSPTRRAVARNSGPCALNLLWGPPSVCVCVCVCVGGVYELQT